MQLVQDAAIDHNRLLRQLTLRAYRFLGLGFVAGKEPVLGELGASPEDFAVAAWGKWLSGQTKFSGDPERLFPFLSKVMTRDILDALKKPGVKLSRQGKTAPVDEMILETPDIKTNRDSIWDIRAMMRDERFMAQVQDCIRDDAALKDFVYTVTEWEGVGVPAPREIAEYLGVSTTEVQNRKRKLARRLVKHGFQIPSVRR